jgi:hypothetical protein
MRDARPTIRVAWGDQEVSVTHFRQTMRAELDNVRIKHTGRLAHASPRFQFTSDGTSQRPKLLLMIEGRDKFKIVARFHIPAALRGGRRRVWPRTPERRRCRCVYGRVFTRRRTAAATPLVPIRTSVVGSGMVLGATVTTMLSRPTGLPQQGVAGLKSVIKSTSIGSVVFEFTVANPPNVFGTVSLKVNTRAEFRKPWN